MNDFFKQFRKEAQLTQLSHAEKQRMRVHLYDAIKNTPLPQPMQKLPRVLRSPYWFFSVRSVSIIALLLIIALGGGTAYAAQGSLPGDPLYTIKVRVNEQVETVLALTPQQKAQVHASIAQTRLSEAEQLAAQGRLDATTTAVLAQNFNANVAQATNIAESLATTSPADAQGITAEIDSSLRAQGDILAELGDASDSTTTKASSRVLLAVVAAQERSSEKHARTLAYAGSPRVSKFSYLSSSVASSTSSSTTPISASSTPQERDAMQVQISLQLQVNAGRARAQAGQDFDAIKDSLNASTTSQIQTELNNIDFQLSAGAAAQQAGDSASSSVAFDQALRASIRLSAFLEAGSKFNTDILPTLLNQNAQTQDTASDTPSKVEKGTLRIRTEW